MTNASIQRACLAEGFCEAVVRCQEAKESAAAAERGPDFRGAGHTRGHPLQLEEGVAVIRRGGDGVGWP